VRFCGKDQVMQKNQSLSRSASGALPPNRRPGRQRDFENLITELEESPSPENTGAIVLNHIAEYDNEFFDALADLVASNVASNRARGRMSRARALETVQDHLRYVCRRAKARQTGQMWAELAVGAAHYATPDAS
jgi:hypothetical protein